MMRPGFIAILLLLIVFSSAINGNEPFLADKVYGDRMNQDTIDRQIIYNGRAWRNVYSRVVGDQFLFTTDYLPGTITIGGRTYGNMSLRYDIYNDEVLNITDRNLVIVQNREMLERFSFRYDNKEYIFRRMDPDSLKSLSGYVNVLYEGEISLYVKYKKEITLLAVDNKYDLFYQTHRIYLEKDGRLHPLAAGSDLIKIMKDYKKQVRSFIRTNRLILSKKYPENFIPVVNYCTTLLQ